MSQLTTELDLKKVMSGGTVFEITDNENPENLDTDTAEEQANYVDYVQQFINMECMNIADDDQSIDKEPFDKMAERMCNLTADGKIKKRILRDGYGDVPFEGSTVKVDYNAYVELEGMPFDSTYARKEPLYLTLNGEGLLGFQIAVKSMKVNEKSHFLIDPELAYKDSGLQRIPPNSTILFEIVLHAITEANQNEREEEHKFDYVYKYCMALCNKANNIFKLKNYKGAMDDYSLALRKLENSELQDYKDQIKYDELYLKLHTNLLVCSTFLDLPKKGCYHANLINQLSKNGTVEVPAKVHYNNAKCLMRLGDLQLAEIKLKRAKHLAPDDPHINEVLAKLYAMKEESRDQERKFGKALLKSSP